MMDGHFLSHRSLAHGLRIAHSEVPVASSRMRSSWPAVASSRMRSSWLASQDASTCEDNASVLLYHDVVRSLSTTLCSSGGRWCRQRHRAKVLASLGSVDDFNVEDDAVVFDGLVHAHRFDQRNHIEKLLIGGVLTIRDSRGRLRITQIAESCVSHVHDRLDGSMIKLFLCVGADGNFRLDHAVQQWWEVVSLMAPTQHIACSTAIVRMGDVLACSLKLSSKGKFHGCQK